MNNNLVIPLILIIIIFLFLYLYKQNSNKQNLIKECFRSMSPNNTSIPIIKAGGFDITNTNNNKKESNNNRNRCVYIIQSHLCTVCKLQRTVSMHIHINSRATLTAAQREANEAREEKSF